MTWTPINVIALRMEEQMTTPKDYKAAAIEIVAREIEAKGWDDLDWNESLMLASTAVEALGIELWGFAVPGPGGGATCSPFMKEAYPAIKAHFTQPLFSLKGLEAE